MVHPRRRLPEYAWDALDILWEEAERRGCTGFARDTAQSLLAADTDLDLSETDIDHTLELLYQRGELYSVEEQFKITGLVMDESPPSDRSD